MPAGLCVLLGAWGGCCAYERFAMTVVVGCVGMLLGVWGNVCCFVACCGG